MNYKKKKTTYKKSNELTRKRPRGFTYGRGPAKEVVNYNEFKKEKRDIFITYGL